MADDIPLTPAAMEAYSRNTPPPPPLPPKRIGRPPGSKNKSTIYREQQGIKQEPAKVKMVIPPPRAPAKRAVDTEEEQDKKEAIAREKLAKKKLRAVEIEVKIREDLNDFIMSTLISVGVPVDALYKPGMAPVPKRSNTNKYTDLGNILAVSDMQASVWARFAAEVEATDSGKKVASVVSGDSKIPLVIYGLGSLVMGVQYMRGVMPVLQRISEANNAMKQSQEQQKGENDG